MLLETIDDISKGFDEVFGDMSVEQIDINKGVVFEVINIQIDEAIGGVSQFKELTNEQIEEVSKEYLNESSLSKEDLKNILDMVMEMDVKYNFDPESEESLFFVTKKIFYMIYDIGELFVPYLDEERLERHKKAKVEITELFGELKTNTEENEGK